MDSGLDGSSQAKGFSTAPEAKEPSRLHTIRFKWRSAAKGRWPIRLRDRVLFAQDGVIEFESEPPEDVVAALRQDGYEREAQPA